MTIELKNYQFILKDIFRDTYVTVYSVKDYIIARNLVIDKIKTSGWAKEYKTKMLTELDEYYNTEEETEIENGTIDFPM